MPGKNKAQVNGRPLTSYTLDAALQAKTLSAIIVTSDDADILELAGAHAPRIQALKRPGHLAGDTTPIVQVIDYLLAEVKECAQADAIMLLQPTAPLREPHHLDEAVRALEQHPEAGSVISVCEMEDVHPARMYNIKEQHLVPFLPALEQARRQDIPAVFYRNGSIYLARKQAYVTQKSIMAKPAVPFVMDRKYLCNIDDPRDLLVADVLVKAWKEGRL